MSQRAINHDGPRPVHTSGPMRPYQALHEPKSRTRAYPTLGKTHPVSVAWNRAR